MASRFLPRFVFVVALLFGVFSTSEGCGRGSIIIHDNGYRQILVAIGDNVPEDTTLIDRIKTIFTDGSKFLYQITKNRAYFHEVTILVPKSWTFKPEYEPVGNETIDKSDFLIDEPDLRHDHGDQPFTIKSTPCGELGHYTHLTPNYVRDDTVAEEYGPYDKILVHEWAHLRYGVFDEYVGQEEGEHFYSDRSGEIQATRCSAMLEGDLYDVETDESCVYRGSLPDENCRFRDVAGVEGRDYASLMYRPKLSHVTEFCDNNSENPDTLHNHEAPSPQNINCNGKSVWEVLREHPDFKNANLPTGVEVTTPNFRVVHQSEKRTVLVLDVSGSMDVDERMEKLGQGVSNYISSIIRDNEELGVAWFNATGHEIQQMTVVTNSSRTGLLKSIPTVSNGGTSIGSGILAGLTILENGGGTKGGNLIIVSDGEENSDPKISAVFNQVMESGTTVHTIAITNDADSNMDTLAIATGGLSFLYSAKDTSNALNDAFWAIGELNVDPMERQYTIFSEAFTIDGYGQQTNSVSVDSSLGRDTEFIFDYSGSQFETVLESPSGVRYDTDHAVCSHDSAFGIYRFSFPGQIPERGTWSFMLGNPLQASQRVAVTLTSRSASPDEYPIVAQSFWGTRSMSGVQGANPDRQVLYASVSQGYAPVLHASVEAIVERPGTTGATSVTVDLRDNGADPDKVKGDGIYSAYFLHFNEKGRYNVKVAVNNTLATVISPQKIVGQGAPRSRRRVTKADDTPTGDFQRVSAGGSFELVSFTPGSGKLYSPGKVTDLRVLAADHDLRVVKLAFTAVGEQLDFGTVSLYDLRYGHNFTDMSINFDNQMSVEMTMIPNNNTLDQPKPAGEVEEFEIMLPESEELGFVFAVKAVDLDGRSVSGLVSNIASATMKAPPSHGLSTGVIIAIVFGCFLFVALIVIIAAILYSRRKMPQDKYVSNAETATGVTTTQTTTRTTTVLSTSVPPPTPEIATIEVSEGRGYKDLYYQD